MSAKIYSEQSGCVSHWTWIRGLHAHCHSTRESGHLQSNNFLCTGPHAYGPWCAPFRTWKRLSPTLSQPFLNSNCNELFKLSGRNVCTEPGSGGLLFVTAGLVLHIFRCNDVYSCKNFSIIICFHDFRTEKVVCLCPTCQLLKLLKIPCASFF